MYPLPVIVYIVENSPTNQVAEIVEDFRPMLSIQVIYGQGNIGFGRAHNLLLNVPSDFHLILNPDVAMAPDALLEALRFMQLNPECGLLSPRARFPDGSAQYLCKQFPSIFDLFLRGFAPRFIKNIFRNRLLRYEMRHLIREDAVYWDPAIVSGCFMFFRTSVWKRVSGFDSRYFLYFEDFDLSMRVSNISRLAYVPSVRIIHHGGHTARKGIWHVYQFLSSALLFYRTYGICLF